MARLALPSVTLCAATSINVDATLMALEASLKQAEFADCLLLTDAAVLPSSTRVRIVPIKRIRSAADYSAFVLRELVNHIHSEHCLIVQWDGFVLDAAQWDPAFLDYDYIGASWPQFSDGFDVGNGGFSLRSRKLLVACRDERFLGGHPEDVTICRDNRLFLERVHGIRFAERPIADRFSFERSPPAEPTFGFHGIFNMVPVYGANPFWEIYSRLDDRRTAFVDYRSLMRQLGAGSNPLEKRIRLTLDLMKSWLS